MSAGTLVTEAERYIIHARRHQRVEAAPPSARELPVFVIPCSRGGGFQASVRGHLLELADPTDGLAPTPDDLRTVSIASDFAWFARRFLRDRGFDDYVSVTASRWTGDDSMDVDVVDITLTVSESAPVQVMLTTALEREFAHKLRVERVRFKVGEA